MLSVIYKPYMLSFIKLSVPKISVIKLSVIMLSVVMMNVVAPGQTKAKLYQMMMFQLHKRYHIVLKIKQLGFSMKVTHLSPVQYWFYFGLVQSIYTQRYGRNPYWLKHNWLKGKFKLAPLQFNQGFLIGEIKQKDDYFNLWFTNFGTNDKVLLFKNGMFYVLQSFLL
jgi:hypothetical protein